MANLTKKQVKSRGQKLQDKIYDLQYELELLRDEIEEEIDSIVPYENRDDLTEAQEERKEYLEMAFDSLNYAIDNLENAQSDLNEMLD